MTKKSPQLSIRQDKEVQMKTVSDNLNIPNLTVKRLVEILTAIYGNAISGGKELKNIPTPFLWGPPGVGKSEGIRQLASELESLTGKHIEVTDVRLLLYTPGDLLGIPVADSERKSAKWLKPKIFDMNPDGDTINILFLDELSSAPQSIQSAAYQLCLDRKVGEHSLPDNCIIIAAGNRTTDRSVSYKMPKALCNRMMHFNIISEFTAWKQWAIDNDIASNIIAFLAMDNSRLYITPDAEDLAYATPRSWAFVSSVLELNDGDFIRAHDSIAACIGNDMAFEFESFCKGAINMPDLDEIFKGVCADFPRGYDTVYALISALIKRIHAYRDTVSTEELDNICTYVKRFPKDFMMLFVSDLKTIHGIESKLKNCVSLNSWLESN